MLILTNLASCCNRKKLRAASPVVALREDSTGTSLSPHSILLHWTSSLVWFQVEIVELQCHERQRHRGNGEKISVAVE